MNRKSVTVFAPATIANLGPGFDVLGLALEAPGDTIRARRRAEPGLGFALRGPARGLPKQPAKNVAAHVGGLLLRDSSPGFGVHLELRKGMPIGSGLGSSAASSVAAALAVNALLPRPLPRRALLSFAIEGERLACGVPHADNVAACLLGGAVLVRSGNPLDVVRLSVRGMFRWTVALPETILRTRDARRLLPRSLPLKQVVRQTGTFAALVTALARGDGALLARSFEDVVAEPVSGPLIPGYAEVKAAALTAGAIGCGISGSGPTVFAVSESDAAARRIGRAMKHAFAAAGLRSRVFHSRLNRSGATVRR